MTYIFDEEPGRWKALLELLGLDEKDVLPNSQRGVRNGSSH